METWFEFSKSVAEMSFVRADLASNCPILNSNVNLTINGFNTPKTMKTDIVKLTLKLNEESYKIPAVWVPCLIERVPVPEISNISNHLHKSFTHMSVMSFMKIII